MAGQRNAGHRAEHAARFAGAPGDMERFAVACDWFRSAAALMARRRPPPGVPQPAHADTAARLVREATMYLITLATAIDRGDYDAK